MSNLKVLQLSWWMKDMTSTDEDILANMPRYKEIEPVFNRPGVYLKGQNCWFEVDGKAFLWNAETFQHKLKTLDAERLNKRMAAALRAVMLEKLATRKQRDLLYFYDHAMELKQIRRDTVLFMKKM